MLYFFLFLDSSPLHEYQIVDGSKIHLSIKKLGDGASSDTDNDFFGLLRNFLRSHFSAQDTERVMSKFKEVCEMFLIILGVLASAAISHLTAQIP